MPSTLDKIDRVDVVRIDERRAAQATHDLRENVDRDLAPREVAESSERDRHGGIDVTSGYPAGHPHTQRRAYKLGSS